MAYKFFWHPIHRTILSRLENASDSSTYLYRFDIDSNKLNIVRKVVCGKRIHGACHADDVCYMFLTAASPKISFNSKEYSGIQRFIGAWINFATNGNPNNENDITIWEKVNKKRPFKCMNFTLDENDILTLPESEKLQIWDSLYPEDILY